MATKKNNTSPRTRQTKPADAAPDLTQIADDLEALQCKLGTFSVACGWLGAAIDGGAGGPVCSVLYSAQHILDGLHDDATALVNLVYALRQGGAS